MYAQFIQAFITDKRVIYADEVSYALATAFELDRKRAALIVNNYLKRQCDNNILHRVMKGTYCPFVSTPFGPVVVQVSEVISIFLLGDDNGYITGPVFLNQIGLSTWVPASAHITSNRVSTKARSNDIHVYKPVTRITKQNKKYLQILDCIRDMDGLAIDAERPGAIVYQFVVANDLDLLKLIIMAHHYYKDIVVKQLLDILREETQYVFT